MSQRQRESAAGVPPAPAAGLTPPPGESGLTSQEAVARLAEYGPNLLTPVEHRPSLLVWLLRPLSDPMVVLLLVAGAAYLLLRDYFDALVTLVAVVPITLVTLVLESRAERTLEQLRRLTAPTATAWRDGQPRVIPAEELVPGDLLLVKEGDILPADGRLVSGTQLMADESALTGESQPVAKDANESAETRYLLAGTTLLTGRGVMRVTATGPSTEYGQIGVLVAGIRPPQTPLQRRIRRLVLQLAVIAGVFCLAVVTLELARGSGVAAALIAGVSLAIATIPEEFPMVFTLYLTLGAWRLARDRALIRRLPGVETLGSTTVICSDKTGTLTMGQLAVAALYDGQSVAPAGDSLSPPARSLLEAAVLASEPDPFDPLEQALMRYAEALEIDVSALHRGELVRDYPFDPALKYMSHAWRRNGRFELFAKGAIEGMLELSGASPMVRERALAANRQLGSQGMRVIAVAGGPLPTGVADRQADERHLRFIGLVGFSDPVRPGVAESLDECRQAGIRVVMITGDHPTTAYAVAESLGFASQADAVVTGDVLDAANEAQLVELVRQATVFARTRPEQKHRLVRALRAQGHVVAMTGDGINDAPALREADVGVAMGQRGTEVARASATLVLLDDNFATIVGAVRDGRRIFENLRRAFTYLIAFHTPLLLGALVVPLAGAPLLLLPVHLVLLELIVHPTSSLVFEADPAPPELMRQPPRRPGTGLLSGGDFLRPLTLGLTLAAGVLALYLVRLATGGLENEARALALATMILGQTVLVLVERSPSRPFWQADWRGNRALPAVLGATVLVLLAVLYVPPLASALRLAPLAFGAWPIVVGVALATTLWREPCKAWAWRRQTPMV